MNFEVPIKQTVDWLSNYKLYKEVPAVLLIILLTALDYTADPHLRGCALRYCLFTKIILVIFVHCGAGPSLFAIAVLQRHGVNTLQLSSAHQSQ